jgi:hypothetical protein
MPILLNFSAPQPFDSARRRPASLTAPSERTESRGFRPGPNVDSEIRHDSTENR